MSLQNYGEVVVVLDNVELISSDAVLCAALALLKGHGKGGDVLKVSPLTSKG